MKNHAVIGTQWGDEGKGKIVDHLTKSHDIVIRFQGGDNAGHTVVVNAVKYPLHLIPSGILHPHKSCLIADGVIVNPETLVSELKNLKKQSVKTAKLYLSSKANLIMPWHVIRDGITGGKIGTTKKGIGPTYADATARSGIRVVDLLKRKNFAQKVESQCKWNQQLIKTLTNFHNYTAKDFKDLDLKNTLDPQKIINTYRRAYKQLLKLGVQIVDGSLFLHQAKLARKSFLFEGAQATLLDIIYGDYPFVTCSHPTVGGIQMGTGHRPQNLHAVGVVKAYSTRVGEGPFPSELNNKIGQRLRDIGHEYGTTTGRPRRCGWLDTVILNYSTRINGLDSFAVTKLDVLSGLKELKVVTGYKYKGTTISNYPVATQTISECKPLYKTLPGWHEDITNIRKFTNLPKNAQKYIKFIEQQTGLSVKYIGVGPEREELIIR
jgi:adenylosuccinate synthase